MRYALIGLIRIYQILLSPLLGSNCRFHPSCSSYAVGVLKRDGVCCGVPRVLWRILRCNPFHPGGYDPVE